MKTYKQKMIDYLETDGWNVAKFEIEELEWWADEIWHLESIWSPSGASAYLTFLVDPQHDGKRNKGQHTWAIGLSKEYPTSRVDAESKNVIPFGKSFKKSILNYKVNMEELRTIE